MDDQTIRIHILQFDPLQLQFPAETEGTHYAIVLPPVHVKVLDLSMGGLLDGAYFGGDIPLFEYKATFIEPVPVTKLVEQIVNGAHLYKKLWQQTQKMMDEKGALLDLERGG